MPRKKKTPKDQLALPERPAEEASLAEETRRRYLNYALSVITSRALPDVRDGLKPVQRRILYTMEHELHLRAGTRYRKSAAIVGDVMGKYHPHGDSAIYDALVRLAQPFTMHAPLVDGRGNFGSPDGDAAAAMRYTEARLQPLASELMAELGSETVAFRPNYDGTRQEPIVLPARFPNLLVNGSQGIAVGMATSIPPHSLGEVLDACVAMIDDPEVSLRQLLRLVKGPDFPTAGKLVATRSELEQAYATGHGSFRLQGEWKVETHRASPWLVITSIPYGIERRMVVEKIAEAIIQKKLPQLLDVRDESTEECRIVCELRKGADPELVAAYLLKHTPLSTNIPVNLTCLTPTEKPEVGAPRRLALSEILRAFLDFRMEVVTKRLTYDLEQLRKRIHILEGFITIFDALDETIGIIRRSDGRKDASKKLMQRFKLDEVQVDAIVELRLYRLAKLEILVLRKELDEKRKEARRLEQLLRSEPARWKLIRAELAELKAGYPTTRKTRIVADLALPSFDAEDFIIDEQAFVVLTQQGWIKRQQKIKEVSSIRVRDGDEVIGIVVGSTRSSVAFFSSHGSCYVCRIVDVPATSGYGAPVQSLFKLADGERIVAAMSFDPAALEVPPPDDGVQEPQPPWALAVTREGMTLRFSLRGHRDPSTKTGRRYCRVASEDEVLSVALVQPGDRVACVTALGRALVCEADEVNLLSGPGKGVRLIRLQGEDYLVGSAVLRSDRDALVVQREGGAQYQVSTRKYGVVSRGGKGFALFKRGRIERTVSAEPTVPVPSSDS